MSLPQNELEARIADLMAINPTQQERLNLMKKIMQSGTRNYAQMILDFGENAERVLGGLGFEDYRGAISDDIMASADRFKDYYNEKIDKSEVLTDGDWERIFKVVAENTFLISMILDPKSDPENIDFLQDGVSQIWRVVGEKVSQNPRLAKIILGEEDWGISEEDFDEKFGDNRALFVAVAEKMCSAYVDGTTDFMLDAKKERDASL